MRTNKLYIITRHTAANGQGDYYTFEEVTNEN